MSTVSIVLEVTGTKDCDDIDVFILLGENLIGQIPCCTRPTQYNLTVDDTPGTQSLQITMRGKGQEHTVVGDDGEIIEDVAVIITKLDIEGIDMIPVFCNGRECYTHSFNDATKPVFVDKFYNYMGCNGTVAIDFYTPVYLWMGDHF